MKRTFLFVLALISFSAFSQSTIVKTENGPIEGTANKTGDIRIFKGVPFAAPPVGNLRWKAPQPVANWSGVRKCQVFGPSPMQGKPTPFMYWSTEFLIPEAPISEDCLYLNVWTGAKSATEKRPVIVFIPGGGFRSGGGACPIYDGEAMAKKGVVFVNINYRLGVFGFMAHPELSQESGHNASGNYALMDMIAALRWVQKNIAALGGDPANVTIAGQSAGAFAVNFLTASPLTKGLFQKAIAESGGSFVASPIRPKLTLQGAEQQGVTFATSLGATSLSELRSKSADDILKANGGLSAPITDGYVVPESIMDIYAKGHQNDVPLIVGWNAEDRVSGPPAKAEPFREQVKKRFADKADDFLAVYPAKTDPEAAQSQIASGRDESFGIQDYTWAKMQTKTGKAPVYMYNFNRKLPAATPETQFGAFHSGEIVYAYNNLHTLNRPWEPVDQSLADAMSSYWVNFAKTGNPNGKNLPKWVAYTPAIENVLILDTTIQNRLLPTKPQLAFWETYYGVGK
ncbi:carboxylesterase family protein [Spirosoma sp. KCTC 42546]|uniref:carboxylesterase/lipase family protein n=1 Tax=Spirosoma sp. KCTC 42546 TaxID=2520506 RepID=UPI00115AE6CC|nr:carboxylesterase family protein [Spirosoma sp. KCTC 42546]QDK80973.1 carboxylesterase family protein [Spirosoma sp. KCTC 42546]